jgi:hypothetical protein
VALLKEWVLRSLKTSVTEKKAFKKNLKIRKDTGRIFYSPGFSLIRGSKTSFSNDSNDSNARYARVVYKFESSRVRVPVEVFQF